MKEQKTPFIWARFPSIFLKIGTECESLWFNTKILKFI